MSDLSGLQGLNVLLGNYGQNSKRPINPVVATNPATPAAPAAQSPGFLGGLAEWSKRNPEQLSIFLDKLGSGLWDKNPFAGFGTSLGQASLMNKAAKEAEAKKDADKKAWHQALVDTLGGNISEAGQGGPTSVIQKKTPTGTTVTVTGDNDGSLEGVLGRLLPDQNVSKLGGLSLSNPKNIVNPW